jgi:type I restriction enzyme S subunit
LVTKLAYRADVQLGKMLDTAKITGGSLRPYLRNTDVQWGKINISDLPLMDFEQDARKKFALRDGDLLVCEGGEIGRVAIWRNELEECFYQKALHRVRPTQGDAPEFLYWSIAAATLSGAFAEGANTTTIAHLPAEKLRAHRFCFPPIKEQHAIVAYLDRETAKIDLLIAKQTEFQARLDEHRRALVTEAVTRGLDPSVPLFDTGRANLGMVTASWAVARLKKFLFKIEQGWSPQCENRPAASDEWGVLKVGCVNGSHFDANENKALPSDLEPIPAIEVRSGDILMSRANTVELAGSISLVEDIQPRLMLCDKLYRLTFDKSHVDSRFIVYCLTSPVGRQPLEASATGASPSMKNISQDAVKDIWLAFPPLAEQQKIADFLDERCAAIGRIRDLVLQMVRRLRERRAALITGAVTGQIDVTEPALNEAAD